jgi:hypothetical protein
MSGARGDDRTTTMKQFSESTVARENKWKSPEARQRCDELLYALGRKDNSITVDEFWRLMRDAGLCDADIDRYCREEAVYILDDYDSMSLDEIAKLCLEVNGNCIIAASAALEWLTITNDALRTRVSTSECFNLVYRVARGQEPGPRPSS